MENMGINIYKLPDDELEAVSGGTSGIFEFTGENNEFFSVWSTFWDLLANVLREQSCPTCNNVGSMEMISLDSSCYADVVIGFAKCNVCGYTNGFTYTKSTGKFKPA